MITITKLNGREIVINADLIESIEENPDTTITMTTGRKFIAKETTKEIINKVVEYKSKISYNHFID